MRSKTLLYYVHSKTLKNLRYQETGLVLFDEFPYPIENIPQLCPTLLELDLSHNLIAHLYEITYIPEQVSKSKFDDLANLEVLDLSGNQIKQLDSNLFIKTPNLRV
jgi:Leucine Rich Repeat.